MPKRQRHQHQHQQQQQVPLQCAKAHINKRSIEVSGHDAFLRKIHIMNLLHDILFDGGRIKCHESCIRECGSAKPENYYLSCLSRHHLHTYCYYWICGCQKSIEKALLSNGTDADMEAIIKSVETIATTEWNKFLNSLCKTKPFTCYDHQVYADLESFLFRLKSACVCILRGVVHNLPRDSAAFVDITNVFYQRYSYLDSRYVRNKQKSSYRYGTTIAQRYHTLKDFMDVINFEGRCSFTSARGTHMIGNFLFRSESSPNLFYRAGSGRDPSFKSITNSVYLFKINEAPSAVLMTIDFMFSKQDILSTPPSPFKEDQAGTGPTALSQVITHHTDKFLLLNGYDKVIDKQCSFLVVDKAFWLCVHSSWLKHMDGTVPYYKLLMKHWFFRTYDPILDAIRKRNVLQTVLSWIAPGSTKTKCFILSHQSKLFSSLYEKMFIIVNRFKKTTYFYDDLEREVKDSFLNDAHLPSLVKSVRDMILIKRDHVITYSVASKIRSLFLINTLNDQDFPVLASVLEELVAENKYIKTSTINDNTLIRESVHINIRSNYEGLDFEPEFGCSREHLMSSLRQTEFDSQKGTMSEREIDQHVRNLLALAALYNACASPKMTHEMARLLFSNIQGVLRTTVRTAHQQAAATTKAKYRSDEIEDRPMYLSNTFSIIPLHAVSAFPDDGSANVSPSTSSVTENSMEEDSLTASMTNEEADMKGMSFCIWFCLLRS